MDFELSSDTLMLRDMLRKFVEDEAKPLEMKYFSAGELEPKDRARLHTVIEQMGLWGITVPEKFGGGGLDMVTACVLDEELGKTFIPLELGDVPPLMYACQGEQVKKFLEPALAGERKPVLALREPGATRPEEWQTSARLEEAEFLLNGKKLLASIPSQKDFLVVMAKSPDGISAFMLEQTQPGVNIHKNGGVLLSLDDCRVGAGALLGECGQALKLGVEDAPRACIQLGARYVGMADRLMGMAVEYANSWVSLGAALKERPAVQRALADTQVQIESTRWLVYHAAWMADKGTLSRSTAAQVRLAAGEMLAQTTDLITMVYGGPGPSPEVDIHRFVNSTVPMKAIEQGLDCARILVAADLLSAARGG